MRNQTERPNLQNIPVRTELAKRLRAAFAELHEPMQVDYSEIEWQILASLGIKAPK